MPVSGVLRRHAVSRLVAGGMVFALLAGCSVAESKADEVDAASPSPLRVTAAARSRRTQIEVRWQIVNPGDRPLLVYTRPLRHDRTPDPRHGIYVVQAADGGVQFVLSAFAPPPAREGEGGGMAAHDLVEAARLAPGERIDGQALVDLPLRSHQPYRSSTPVAQPLPMQARVCIGALDVAEPLPGHIQSMAGGRFAVYHESAAVAQQSLACSDMFTVADGN